MRHLISLLFFILLTNVQNCLAQTQKWNAEFSELINYDKLIQNAQTCQEKAEAEKDYQTLLGIAEDLAKYRNIFLTNGKFINLFPTAYYHTTILEMKRIANGEFTYPIEKMKQMIAFYEAYKYNRINWENKSYQKVEEHWKRQFKYSANILVDVNPLCSEVGEVLSMGIIAHVVYDFPRTIKYAFETRFNKSLSEDNPTLELEFKTTQTIFENSANLTIEDVAKIRHCKKEWISLSPDQIQVIKEFFPEIIQTTNALLPNDVIELRNLAYIEAFQKKAFTGVNGETLSMHPTNNNINQLTSTGKKVCDTKKPINSEENKIVIREKTLSYFRWLNDVWHQKTTPKFKLLTTQNEIDWTEIEKYLSWLNNNCPFFGCNFEKNMREYFQEVDAKWKLVPPKFKQETEAESPFEEIFSKWFIITNLSYNAKYTKAFKPGAILNIKFYPNEECLVSIPGETIRGVQTKDLDLLWKMENGEWKIAFTEFMMPRWKNVEYQKKWNAFYNSSRF